MCDFPQLVREWHPTRNGALRPEGLSYGSGRHVWWRCSSADAHEWQATPNSRTWGQSGCPYCAGRRASATNNLRVVAPHLAAEWHPVNNRELRPEEIVAGSTRRVWWKCARGRDHEWRASAHDRLQSKGKCPLCLGKARPRGPVGAHEVVPGYSRGAALAGEPRCASSPTPG